MVTRHQAELEQLIIKYQGGILPDATILHGDFGRVVWLIDHPTSSVFTLTGDNELLVGSLVETQEFDTPEKRVYTNRSNGKRFTWSNDDFSLVSEIKQRHKLITMQLVYEKNLDASLKNDHDDNINFEKGGV